MKNLVIYFSRTGNNYVSGTIQNLKKGNSEIVAEYIQEILGADLFEVERKDSYSLDYTQCTKEAQEELRNHARPELKKVLKEIESYENIFVVGPCWWGTYPMPVFTQLEALDFTGKNVYPVMTHEGSGLANAVRDCQKFCHNANVKSGLAIHGTHAKQSKETIINWLGNFYD